MNDTQLALYRNRIIEQCARVVENSGKPPWPSLAEIAAAIRSLKDKP